MKTDFNNDNTNPVNSFTKSVSLLQMSAITLLFVFLHLQIDLHGLLHNVLHQCYFSANGE